MADKLTERDKALWVAGYLSNTGTFLCTARTAQLVVKSSLRPEALRRAAEYLDMDIPVHIDGKGITRFTLSGNRLHSAMTKVWDYLPMQRKKEYAAVRKLARTRAEYLRKGHD